MRVTAAGAFTLTGVMPGLYLVAAIRDEEAADWPDEAFLARIAPLASSVQIGAGAQTTIRLRLGSPR